MNFGTRGCMYCEGECNKECLSQEEPKQETLEEAAERWNEKQTTLEFGKPHNAPNRIKAFIEGAKSDAARDYWFEQFKKK